MKKKTKILVTLFFTLTFFSCLALFAFASEGEVTKEEENVFASIYEYLERNADKIFSLLAFLGAIILSFAYKKGLFPFVEKAMTALSGAVKSLKEETEKSNKGTDSFMEELTKKLAISETVLSEFGQKLSSLEEKLSEAALLKDKNEEFRLVMLAEVEMIYDIFTSSSLPDYQKEKLGEAYLKMKRALAEKEE